MNLDDPTGYGDIDRADLLTQIDDLPDQLWQAWQLGQQLALPQWQGIRQVIVAGMGGSAIGADLLAGYAQAISPVPISVHRDYDLPAWCRGPETLVIASSHSGNTEETLSAFTAAQAAACRILAIATGGKLSQMAAQAGVPAWQFTHHGQPRAAAGFSFGLLAAAMSRLGLLPDLSSDLAATVAAMRAQQEMIRANVPSARNPAKRMAGQLMGRWVVVIGSGILAPVARRWKGQISELAKSWAQFEFLPEVDHNTLAGVMQPEEMLPDTMVIFLRGAAEHPRNRLRIELTKKTFMLEGIGTDFIDAAGESPLEQLWTCLHFGDYIAYYLAIGYGIDPTPIPAIEGFKRELAAAKQV